MSQWRSRWGLAPWHFSKAILLKPRPWHFTMASLLCNHPWQKVWGCLTSETMGTMQWVWKHTHGPLTCEPWCTDACAVEALAVTGSTIQTADVSTGVLIQFTVCSCREANEKGWPMEHSPIPVAFQRKGCTSMWQHWNRSMVYMCSCVRTSVWLCCVCVCLCVNMYVCACMCMSVWMCVPACV